jgi:hypothetical protein
MLYLVRGENIDSGYLLPPEQVFQITEQAIVPSFQVLAGMAAEGKLKGGVYPGERGGAFVIDAGSPEELDAIINHLPFFGLIKWEVKALMPFAAIAERLPQYLADHRQAMSQGGS